MRLRLIFAFVLLLPVSNALAWSYKEHILFARLAVMRLVNDPTTPPAMKAWLHDAIGEVPDMAAAEDYFLHVHIGTTPRGFTGISYWAYMPDVHALTDRAAVKVDPFNVHERLLHFIDLELFLGGDQKREYKHDLSNKPKLSDIPHDMNDPRFIQAGMLPFRIEQCYGQLVKSIREGQLHASSVEAQEGKTATYWAGYLAHYLADNTQPQHATMDFKSISYFANKTRSPNVHAEVEYRICDDDMNDFMDLRKEYWPMFVKQIEQFDDPVQTKDLWQSSVEVSLRSYDALPLIGLAAMHATKQGGTPDHPQGPASEFNTEIFFRFRGQYMGREMSVLEMKAIQTAWAVKRIEKTLRQAWIDASK